MVEEEDIPSLRVKIEMVSMDIYEHNWVDNHKLSTVTNIHFNDQNGSIGINFWIE